IGLSILRDGYGVIGKILDVACEQKKVETVDRGHFDLLQKIRVRNSRSDQSDEKKVPPVDLFIPLNNALRQLPIRRDERRDSIELHRHREHLQPAQNTLMIQQGRLN